MKRRRRGGERERSRGGETIRDERKTSMVHTQSGKVLKWERGRWKTHGREERGLLGAGKKRR